MRVAVVALIACLVTASVEAHVRIAPAESKAGATETYAARVPTEGKVATTSVRLEVPDGVAIVAVRDQDGVTHEFERQAERIVAVTWKVNIPAGQAAELKFVAKNPAVGTSVVWKVHQGYADGTSSHWVGAASDRAPAPVTKLVTSAQ